jgi:hypothetical protein
MVFENLRIKKIEKFLYKKDNFLIKLPIKRYFFSIEF